MKKAYEGSCHCKAIRFICDLDLNPAPSFDHDGWSSTVRCTCAFCTKTGFWKAYVHAEDFQLLDCNKMVADYQFGQFRLHHVSCPVCGVHPFARGDLPQAGGHFYCINLNCLDDVSAEELATTPVQVEDGQEEGLTLAGPGPLSN